MHRVELRGDCANCFGLCCVALPFTASTGATGFPVTKPAATPCRHLDGTFRCGIHARLRQEGYCGCTVYDCFGAGQRVSRHTFGGRDWRAAPETARQMYAVFAVPRDLHELLWYVAEALTVRAAKPLAPELRRAQTDLAALTGAGAGRLEKLPIDPLRRRIGALLEQVGELARAGLPGARHRGADLAGARLAGTDLRGANLRGALLIAADLRGADLRSAELLGTDCRDTDLRGADLTGALFLTRPQLAAARGDAATRLPGHLDRPAHWR